VIIRTINFNIGSIKQSSSRGNFLRLLQIPQHYSADQRQRAFAIYIQPHYDRRGKRSRHHLDEVSSWANILVGVRERYTLSHTLYPGAIF
jgi:hypothetical protein